MRPVLWSTSYLLRSPLGISIVTSNSTPSSLLLRWIGSLLAFGGPGGGAPGPGRSPGYPSHASWAATFMTVLTSPSVDYALPPGRIDVGLAACELGPFRGRGKGGGGAGKRPAGVAFVGRRPLGGRRAGDHSDVPAPPAGKRSRAA